MGTIIEAVTESTVNTKVFRINDKFVELSTVFNVSSKKSNIPEICFSNNIYFDIRLYCISCYAFLLFLDIFIILSLIKSFSHSFAMFRE